MAAMQLLALGATALGTMVQARATLAAGKQAQAQANYEAQVLDMQAKEEQAAAQREAQEEARQRDLALGQLQTRAAASGFSATDPTSLALAQEIATYGTYKESLRQYGGERERAKLEAGASNRRAEGRAARDAARTGALSTIIGGITSMANIYGKTPKYG